MSQMRSYVYAIDPAINIAKCKDEERFWLPRVMIGDVRYHNFKTLVATTLSCIESKVELRRIYHSRGNGPWIDAIPTEFRDTMAKLEFGAAEKLAAKWNVKCNWGSYGHWIAPWESLVGFIVLQVRTVAQFAVSREFNLYYSQDARLEW